jgi:hypothetical protein
MNGQIQKLAEQAGYRPLPGFDFANSLEEVFIAKFAELIVQECVNVLHDNELWSRDVSHVLKEHFGVE